MKNWLRNKNKSREPKERSLTADELVALGRADEARQGLEGKLRENPRDRRTQVKLGDVLMVLERPIEALELYEAAAQGLASDGFHDKSKAVLRKMLRIDSNNQRAITGLEQLERAKEIERRRRIVERQLRTSHVGPGQSIDSFRVNQLWRNLAKSPLIEELSTQSLSRLFEHLALVEFERGQELVGRGDRLEELFVVAEGNVEVIRKRPDGPPVILRTYGPGDVFGEGSLLEHQEWAAAHRSQDRSKLLKLDSQGLAAVLPGLEDPRAFLDTLRKQRHDASLAAMVRTNEES